VIRSFRDKEAGKVFRRELSRRFPTIAPLAKRKLDQLNAAVALSDLSAIPGNRLEALAGSRKGQHSVRIIDQWRICFYWSEGEASEVEIVDYH
jgi:proteic killer suppression protein